MQAQLNRRKLLLTGVLLSLFATSASAAVTSVDLLQFKSNSEFYDGPVYIISTTSNYNTDEFHYFLDNRRLSQGVSGKVHNTVTIDITSQTSKAVYGTRETGKPPIWKPEATTFVFGTNLFLGLEEMYRIANNNEKVQETCWDIDGDGTDRTDYALHEHVGTDILYGLKIYCVKKGERLGNVGEIASNPKDVFKTEWKLTNNAGKIEKATISNSGMGQGVCERIGPNSRVCFQGILSSGKNSPVPTDELVLHSNSITENNGFRIIDRGDYRTYLDSIPNMASKIDEWGSPLSSSSVDGEDVTSAVRQNAEEAVSPHDSSEFTDARFTGSSIGSGKIELRLDKGIWPTFTIELRACRNVDLSQCNAFVNIKRTVGEPKITGVFSKKFSELETGQIQVTYKNIGGAEGGFSARVSSCQKGFSFTGVAERAVLGPGESTTASFPISFSSQSTSKEQITKSCIVQVEELGTGETVSTSVQVTGIQQSECEPGKQFKKTQVIEVKGEDVERDVIYECNQNGLGTHRVKTCGVDEQAVAQGSTYQCLEEGSGGNGGAGGKGGDCTVTWINNPAGNDIDGPDIGCHFNKLASGVYGIFTITAMFFGFLFGYGQRIWITGLANLKGGAVSILGRDVRARWIIGLITGTLFAILIAGALSNPIVKWGLIIGVPLYLIVKAWLFSPADVIMAFLPIE